MSTGICKLNELSLRILNETDLVVKFSYEMNKCLQTVSPDRVFFDITNKDCIFYDTIALSHFKNLYADLTTWRVCTERSVGFSVSSLPLSVDIQA